MNDQKRHDIHWDNYVASRLIGRGKPYPTIRLLVQNIVNIQNEINNARKIWKDDKVNLLSRNDYTARGIEDLGFKTYMSILENKLDESYFALNRFRNVSDQIPEMGGQVNCILDYIMHGATWIMTEIRSHTIETRFDKDNCISYIKEAEKLTGRRFR